MAIRDLKDQILRLPEQPGVYLYLGASGETLYIGRARVLRDRVRSYLSANGSNPKTDALLNDVVRLEIIVTDSLVEALALENNLIKQRRPRYNILLRDDKNYPYLQLTTTEAYPRVLVARKVEEDGNVYAGPFLPSKFARRTMSLTHKLFGIRSCNEVINGKRGRACLEYDIKRCIAPCVDDLCTRDEYGEAVERAQMFLAGRNDDLLVSLREQMVEASSEQRYERAAQVRDTIHTIETLRDRMQKMAGPRLGERDVFGWHAGDAGGFVHVFQLRGGRVIEKVELVTEGREGVAGREVELLRAAVRQFYEMREPPVEIHLPVELEDGDEIERWLTQRSEHRVRIKVPKRGEKHNLMRLANRNATVAYKLRLNSETRNLVEAYHELREVLGLPAPVNRIECFDISTIQGADTVGALVVHEDGRMLRREYRKFHVRGLLGNKSDRPDDFAAMEEVILRRYRRLLEHGGPFPDLVVVDGGLGQVSAAYKAFEQLGLSNLIAIGIAKKEELLYLRGQQKPVSLPLESAGLHLIQRIRDEAHRVAVNFHRKTRAKRDFRSELDLIPGIGSVRRRRLLQRFGNTANVGRATHEELLPIVGPKAAETLINYFSNAIQRL